MSTDSGDHHDVHAATGSATAREALDHIAGLYAVEHDARGRPPDERRRERQARAGPLLAHLPRERVLTDGRICLTNNAAERALRGIALGRKAWLFAVSDRGCELTYSPKLYQS